MNDKQYLDAYIDAIKLTRANDPVAIVAMDYINLFVTDAYKRVVEVDDIIGKRLKDVNSYINEHADKIKRIGSLAERLNKTAVSLCIIVSKSLQQNQCYILRESIIINPGTNNNLARLIDVQIVNINFINQIIYLVNNLFNDHNKPNIISNSLIAAKTKEFTVKLSQREEEVLFLLLLGKSYKSISNILSSIHSKEIKQSTVNGIINGKLMGKFDTFSVDELILKAVQHAVIETIPLSLIQASNGFMVSCLV